jgi:hypothetical protein
VSAALTKATWAAPLVMRKKGLFNTVKNLVDCCEFFWTGRQKTDDAFCAGNARRLDIEGAILNEQLNRLPGLIKKCRSVQQRVYKGADQEDQ